MEKIRTHRDLKVYQLSFEVGMEVFRLTKSFPKAFVAKLSDSEGEAAETQVWLDYALACEYIDSKTHSALNDKYDHIIGMLINMSNKPENWSF
jgi:hypothetical protein